MSDVAKNYQGDLSAAIKGFLEREDFEKDSFRTVYRSRNLVVTYVVQHWPNRSPTWGNDCDAKPDTPITHVRLTTPSAHGTEDFLRRLAKEFSQKRVR